MSTAPAAKPRTRTRARTTPRPAAKRRPAAAAPAKAQEATKAKKAAEAVKPSKPVKPVKPVKAAKPPKVRSKPVRDSFTMPEADFALIATLKARTLAARRETKKSELLRAGLHALAALDTPALVAALGALEPVKIGRPKSGH